MTIVETFQFQLPVKVENPGTNKKTNISRSPQILFITGKDESSLLA